jgi:(1->4)-alpha-D-glucan 1-alpha-D-glucosylmutase
VLSEIPGLWRGGLSRWTRQNRKLKVTVDDTTTPSRNEEYLLYQTLVGTWPFCNPDDDEFALFRTRIKEYMLKAMREAKIDTSWISPNVLHEDAVISFIDSILEDSPHNNFLHNFISFQKLTAACGIFNSLSQTLLKITSPGIPDFYQGNELWDFSLVDPDNRRFVDYLTRKDLLEELFRKEATEGLLETSREVVANRIDGRIKLHLTCKALNFRRENRELFETGRYLPLAVEGICREHLCAFERSLNGSSFLVVVPRFFSHLIRDSSGLPLGPEVWQDTRISLSSGTPASRFRNIFTGEMLNSDQQKESFGLMVSDVLADYPVALLERVSDTAS